MVSVRTGAVLVELKRESKDLFITKTFDKPGKVNKEVVKHSD